MRPFEKGPLSSPMTEIPYRRPARRHEWHPRRAPTRRQEQAQLYFDQIAGRFDRSYGPGRSWQAFGQMLLRIIPALTIADLGAGEGLLSELLARRAKKVIAVDNSEKIVAFGAKKAKKNGLKNLEFRLGDLEEPPIEPQSVDLAILSQALHHARWYGGHAHWYWLPATAVFLVKPPQYPTENDARSCAGFSISSTSAIA